MATATESGALARPEEPDASEGTLHAAAKIREALPCSIELPAGAGKTHLIAELANDYRRRDQRVLVLTHTHAGVDALRRQIRDQGGSSRWATVRTIDGWCLDLIAHFPDLAGLHVGDQPDWEEAESYRLAAERAIRAPAVRRMLEASYALIAVDEYQDCVLAQHQVVAALREVVPTAVFGDPLQGLFHFGDNQPVSWEEVLTLFPACDLPIKAWRWEGKNEELGRWLLAIRPSLKRGEAISLEDAPVHWRCIDNDGRRISTQTTACFGQPEDGSVVALGHMSHDCHMAAAKLNGSYSMMEELEGKQMLKFAEVVDLGDAAGIAKATVEFARECAVGVAEAIEKRKRDRLGEGKTISTKKAELNAAHAALSDLLEESSPAAVRSVLHELEGLPRFQLFRREAWSCIIDALRQAALDPQVKVSTAVRRLRNHDRIVGRRPAKRIVSRPLLVKGLQYDHAVLLDADRYNAAELYVALSRGCRAVTVLSSSPVLTPAAVGSP
jgi:ribosome-associated protein YbcJ (S4-like RNA binding protein)